ncbi:STAS domain-containing protein [Streptomyces libani]|uniref:Anti-anti-sigma factor n=2 Tax=Streptomyces nigrescens TaxID=1920 RepID=A0A640T835_STRNI|nr:MULTISPECIES: STAS domain-containing protein [Streptomyces]MCW7984812.1 anti-anti-sigma factor [Streptomyces platensis subsp. clarensis]AWN31540.1 STAS domain-containing protein [Streptomyces sp. NEAU-S7GS2]MCR8572739.1 STAS domain-containing protein [Streptomyces sp. Isolate_219]MCX5445695.1 STAS domain-containing protein [Streptomyces libani]MYT10996.1 STAS domain-containing protein [Streptomyces sp. SID4951]
MNAPASGGVPILRLGDVLVTGLLNELDDKTAVAFTQELTDRITSDGARGVLIDISRLEIVDSFVARTLMELTTMARLLGARVIVAGMRPPVAITLVELGLQLTGVETALNAEQGMAALGWRQSPQPSGGSLSEFRPEH